MQTHVSVTALVFKVYSQNSTYETHAFDHSRHASLNRGNCHINAVFSVNGRRNKVAPGTTEPPPIPAQAGDQKGGSVKSEEYIIPQYPEPPVPALSPPSTMPFAIFDQEHSNAFEPPEQTVKSANKLVEQAEERKKQGQVPLAFKSRLC